MRDDVSAACHVHSLSTWIKALGQACLSTGMHTRQEKVRTPERARRTKMSYTHYPYQPAPKPAWYKRLFGLCKRHPIITALFIIAFLEIGAAGSITAASQVTT